MLNSTATLYALVALLWGSSWIAITFQLGSVDPLISVIYRFVLATGFMFGWCAYQRQSLRLPVHYHFSLAVQGCFLFGFNYWVLYQASQYVTSGLIAVIFSTIVFFNALNGWLFLRMPVRSEVLLGGVIGLAGIVLLFWPQLDGLGLSNQAGWGLILAFISTFMASLGNIAAAANTARKIPIVVINCWAMLYGTLTLAITAAVLGIPYTLDFNTPYILSWLYLAIGGTIITFAGYLQLIHRLGADKAAYMSMVVPVIALLISSVFEDYQWTAAGALGLLLILLGNWWAMRKKD